MIYAKYLTKILNQEEILNNASLMIGKDSLIGKKMDKNLLLPKYIRIPFLKMMAERMVMV